MNSVWLQWSVRVEMSNQGHLDVPFLPQMIMLLISTPVTHRKAGYFLALARVGRSSLL